MANFSPASETNLLKTQIGDYMEKYSARAAIQLGLKSLALFEKPSKDLIYIKYPTQWKRNFSPGRKASLDLRSDFVFYETICQPGLKFVTYKSQQNFSPASWAEISAHAEIHHVIRSLLPKCKGRSGGISAQELDGSDQVVGGPTPCGQYGSE